eukprot:TRINITY_DN1496_c0_g1_i4.p1 TRINITY_DN1496_c0_g1~~TRINITY_DN1496_c0_g1_i4.p1  ORF type:complete len:406 (+),score=95.60 TRINITY_DN1496_c0_g1_i4:119-1219(+)
MWHDTGNMLGWYPAGIRRKLGVFNQPDIHYENAETKRRFYNLLGVSGLLDQLYAIKPRRATVDEVARVHTRSYMERVEVLSHENGGDAGECAPVGVGSYDIALLSAGGVISAVDAVWNGQCKNAYALVRPPGHHAEADKGRGFCLFNNIAIAAKHAREVLGAEKVAILDWDVHHGNGTQQAFYEDPSVLFISIHQDGLFPAEGGKLDEVGRNAGVGYNINIPLPPGSGIGAYQSCLSDVILPALRAFQPSLILVSCGFDAAAFDPIAHMMLASSTYAHMTRELLRLAEELPSCQGRVVLCHEGGYSNTMVPYCGLVVMQELSEIQTEVKDPYLEEIEVLPYQALQPHQEQIIRQAAQHVKTYLTHE